jgi:hypothetical protein
MFHENTLHTSMEHTYAAIDIGIRDLTFQTAECVEIEHVTQEPINRRSGTEVQMEVQPRTLFGIRILELCGHSLQLCLQLLLSYSLRLLFCIHLLEELVCFIIDLMD